MKQSRPSILESATLGPPPAIALGERAATRAPRPISVTRPEGVREAANEPSAEPKAAPMTPRFSLRKRLAALLALVAVPAMAAPGDFGAIAGDAPSEDAAFSDSAPFAQTMAFERPGMSFPGSALRA